MGLVAMAATCLLASAIAQSPVGAWKGKLNIKMPPMPANADPQMKAMMEKGMAAARNMTINLTMKKDNTYTLTTTGAPAEAKGKQDDNGTWKISGKTVTVVSKKKNGMGNQKPQTMTLSADGKTMTMPLPGRGGSSQGSLVFKKS